MSANKRQYQQNIINPKRAKRRALGWPSGRQWVKMRKAARRAGKPIV